MAGLLYRANEYRKLANMSTNVQLRRPQASRTYDCAQDTKAELLRRISSPDSAELVALNVRNEVALDPEVHCHERGGLFVLTEGLLVVETAAGRHLSPPRSIGWMPPGVPHAVQSYGPIAGYGVFLVPDCCADLPTVPTNYQNSPLVELVLQRALSWPHDAPLDPPRMRLLQVLLDELGQTPTQPLQLPWPHDARLLAVTRALVEDVASPRTLEQWAGWASISARSLSRKFQQETGMSFAQWRQWARLIQAMEWLATGRAVKDVALSLGYDSVSAFIQTFRRALGATPAVYFQQRRGAFAAGTPGVLVA